MEKSTSEYTKQIDEMTKTKALIEEEKTRFIFWLWQQLQNYRFMCRLNEQLEGLKEEVKGLPTSQDLKKLVP